jgi:hypothetical protein
MESIHVLGGLKRWIVDVYSENLSGTVELRKLKPRALRVYNYY